MVIDTRIYSRKINFQKYLSTPEEEPLESVSKMITYGSLASNQFTIQNVLLRKNTYELYDNWYEFLGYPTKSGQFYNFQESVGTTVLNRVGRYQNILYNLAINPSDTELSHSRQVYTIIELFGDVGGVLEIFVLLFIFFVQPLTEFSLSIQFIEKFQKQKTPIYNKKHRHKK